MERIIDNILSATCGKDQNGNSKASLVLLNQLYDENTDTLKDNGQRAVYKPVISVQKHGNYIQVDLEFPSVMDADIKILWTMLEKYGEQANSYNDKNDLFPISILTLVPVEFDGKFYISATNPITWSLQPARPGGQNNIIRILYQAEEFTFCQTDEIDADNAKREAAIEVERELLLKDEYEAKEQALREEEEEYQKNRNEKLEELRKNHIGN